LTLAWALIALAALLAASKWGSSLSYKALCDSQSGSPLLRIRYSIVSIPERQGKGGLPTKLFTIVNIEDG